MLRILLLEDQATDAELVERELRRSGVSATVVRVANEADFREALRTMQADVVLADYHLPGFDGLEALEITRAADPDLPFIFVSGSIGEERAVEALRSGATDYVLKDRMARLRTAIERALGERHVRRQLEQERRISSLGRIAATMAHEFNNVLMGVQPFAEIIARHYQEPRLQQIAEQLRRSVKRGKTVTQEILRFANDSELELVPTEIGPWLLGLAPELRALLGRAELVLEIASEPLVALTDGSALQQVVTNLVINARDAMPHGGVVTIRARMVPRAQAEKAGAPIAADEVVQLSIADTGAGMPAEVLERIFEPMFTTKRKGSGLGLSVAAQIISRHHGHLFAQSAVGHGTTFNMFLPRAAAGTSVAAEENGEAPSYSRLLLVEDDPDVIEAATALLEEGGFTIEVAETGAASLDAIERSVPDAVLLDLGLPDQNGFSVYRKIAARWPALPVIFASGHVAESRVADDIGGRTAVLTKPYGLEELAAALARVAKRH